MKFENFESSEFHTSSQQFYKFNFNTSQSIGAENTLPSLKKPNNIYLKEISNLKYEEVIFNYHFLCKLFTFIDYTNSVICSFTITILYYEHYLYIENDFKLLSKNNIIRIITLSLSVLSCILLSIKYINRPFFRNLKYVLKLRFKDKMEFRYKHFIMKCLIILLQPYPYLSYKFNTLIKHRTIIYNLNSFLFSLCVLKLYFVVKVIRKWIYFSNNRTKRVRMMFTLDNKFAFIYKGLLKGNLFMTLSVLINAFLFSSAFLFKIFEDYSGNNNPFSSLYNCVWYLIVTMNTTGYGEFVPITFMGRIICVFVCFLGIFILSLLVSSLTIYSELINGEQNVYNEIERLELRQDLTENYFKTHLELLVFMFKKRSNLFEWMLLKNKIKILRNTKRQDIKSLHNRENSLIEFNINFQEICEELEFKEMIRKDMIVNVLRENISNLSSKNNCLVDSIIYSSNKSYQMYNLSNFIALAGNISHFENINQITSKKLIKNEDICMKLRELRFKIKFTDTINYASDKYLSNISCVQKSFCCFSSSSE